MAERIPQSVTIRVPLQVYLASDHVTPATGKTIAITISKNGAAYGNPSGGATNATEIGSGSYYVDLSTTDTGTVGPLFVKGVEGTIDTVIAIYDVAVSSAAEITAIKAKTDFLPSATAGAAGGLFIAGTNAATVVTTSFTTTFTGNLTGSVASVTGAVGSVTGLTASNLDATISSRLATAGYTAPDNAGITTISGKVAGLTYTVANRVDSNIRNVNGTAVTGNGSPGTEWGP